MKNLSLIVFLVSTLFLACKDDTKETKHANHEDSYVETFCLSKIASNPCRILSTDNIASICGVSNSELRIEEPYSGLKDPKTMLCQYAWNSNRTKTVKVLGASSEQVIDNIVRIGGVNILTSKELDKYGQTKSEYFDSRYGEKTEAQKVEDMEQMTEKLNEKMKDKTDIEKTEAEHLIKMMKEYSLTAISGIGEMASWHTGYNTKDGILQVLYQDVIFQVIANVSNDTNESLLVAKKIANKIISNCN